MKSRLRRAYQWLTPPASMTLSVSTGVNAKWWMRWRWQVAREVPLPGAVRGWDFGRLFCLIGWSGCCCGVDRCCAVPGRWRGAIADVIPAVALREYSAGSARLRDLTVLIRLNLRIAG